ncbi:MAG: ATP-binding cassette domain-containing protein, partial [Candidatus Margulisbacteria bacterium]|nr:ATP-binding cassette domain-containing protein [Candidatus Margulisiibacteriota bacterium]
MIKLENLTKYFDQLKVLQGVNLEVKDGESLAVIGPSGCGKSTLLKLLIRLEEPTSGRIIINNMDVHSLSEDGLTNLRKKVGFVFQSAALFDSMNVYENVAFALRAHTKYDEPKIAKII